MIFRAGVFIAALVVLAGCGERDVILPGERQDIRPGALTEEMGGPRDIRLAEPRANADWTHRNGSPTHMIRHPALGASLSQAFAAPIGEGDGRRVRITADPVVAGGRVFTLDAISTVTATSTSGVTLWSQNLTPPTDSPRDASGGGLAVAGEVLLVSTGFGELIALDAATGVEIWTQDLDAPGNSAPTVVGDLVYVVSRDGRAWAVELGSGRIAWTLSGTPPEANFAGGSGAAVTGEIAVIPFPSGEVIATFPEGGLRRWSTVIAGERPGSAAASVSDIAGDPVIDGQIVYTGNVSGRVAALALANGERLWTATEGAAGPLWPAGDSLFFVNDLSQLVRIDAGTGDLVWRVQLPEFEEDRPRRQKTRYVHYGPVLAGGRLIVASSDGTLRQFAPDSGALLAQSALPGGAASNPVVAGETLYVVTRRGQLLAYR